MPTRKDPLSGLGRSPQPGRQRKGGTIRDTFSFPRDDHRLFRGFGVAQGRRTVSRRYSCRRRCLPRPTPRDRLLNPSSLTAAATTAP